MTSVTNAFSAFANPMIFLFMGGFLIAKGMMANGLDKRIAYGIMSRIPLLLDLRPNG